MKKEDCQTNPHRRQIGQGLVGCRHIVSTSSKQPTKSLSPIVVAISGLSLVPKHSAEMAPRKARNQG